MDNRVGVEPIVNEGGIAAPIDERKKVLYDIFFPLHPFLRSEGIEDANPIVRYPTVLKSFHQFSLFRVKRHDDDVLWENGRLVPVYLILLGIVAVTSTCIGAAVFNEDLEEAARASALGAVVSIPASRMIYWCAYLNMNAAFSCLQKTFLVTSATLAFTCQIFSAAIGQLVLHGNAGARLVVPSFLGYTLMATAISLFESDVSKLCFFEPRYAPEVIAPEVLVDDDTRPVTPIEFLHNL